jgi:hypothetical protein
MSSLLNPTLAFWIVLAFGAAIFVGGALLWLRRLRQSLATAVADALTRQVNHGAKVEEALLALQRNQKQQESHLQALAAAQQRSRGDISVLSQRLDQQKEMLGDGNIPRDRVIH